MKRHLAIAALSLAAALPAPGAAQGGPNMQPGLWEITTRTMMPGMPVAMPPQVVRHCYRAEALKDPKSAIPHDSQCKVDTDAVSGSAVSWRMSCRMDGDTLTGRGRIVYEGQSYAGKVQMSGRIDGETMEMQTEYAGRRIGDCR